MTTNWDDGSKWNKAIARLLRRYHLRGTFYLPVKYRMRGLTDDERSVYADVYPDLAQLRLEPSDFEILNRDVGVSNDGLDLWYIY